MAKGGGHGKGQTMQFRSVRAFDGGKPMRAGHWSLTAARHSVRDSLVAANARSLDLEAKIVDKITGDTVWEPAKCAACRTAWATEAEPEGGDEWSRCRDCADEVVVEQPAELAEYRRPSAGAVAAEPVSALPVPDGPAEVAERLREMVAEQQAEGVPPGFEAAVAPFLRTNPLPDADPSALLDALGRLNLPRAVWSDGTVAAVANGMLWTLQAEPHATTGTPCGVWSVASPIAVRGYFLPERAARFIRDRRSP